MPPGHALLTVRAADGTEIRVHDGGRGPVILIVHPGLDDGSMWTKPAAELARRFRVVRIHRRQYRVDLKTDGKPCSIAQEVDDVLALAKALGEPSGSMPSAGRFRTASAS